MLNAEMILKKGIKPENLYIKTEIPNEFGDTTWSIYDDESKELIGQLTLQAIARECFSGKIFKPIEVWLCCDGAFTTYIPTKVISQDDPSDMIFTKKSKLFQCKRMASLFKTEYSDGRCTYSDNTRCCCENISDHCRYYSGKSRKIIKKMFPITMPYVPKDHYVLWLTRLNQSQENYLVRHT